MDERTVYLLNQEHVGHPMHFLLTPAKSASCLKEHEDGGVEIPEGSKLVRLDCVLCGCTLEEGKDYQFGRPTASTDAGNESQAEEDWLNAHWELYPDTGDEHWLREHRRLYGS